MLTHVPSGAPGPEVRGADRLSAADLLSAAEVAHRLGVKRETVYAYVSRGLLERHPASGHQRSLFAPSAVERVAAQARHHNRSGALEVVVETAVTGLDPAGRLLYRGRDATELARFRSFEEVAALLWDVPGAIACVLQDDDRELVAGVLGPLGVDVAPLDRVPVAIAALGATDLRRADRRPEAVVRAGARILAGALQAVGAGLPATDAGPKARAVTRANPGPVVRSHVARQGEPAGRRPAVRRAAPRLWSALRADADADADADASVDADANADAEADATVSAVDAARIAAVDAALVLLADHELAASTLAARVAASTWADPYRVVLAGLGPLAGPLHGAASLAAGALLAEVTAPALAPGVLDRYLAAGAVPGFGHRVYRDRDPRADVLLARIPAIAIDPQRVRCITAVLDAAASLGVPAPNVDFALAALADAIGLRRDAALILFTIARIAGMIAHALEEYPHQLRFRPRATYVGPTPSPPAGHHPSAGAG